MSKRESKKTRKILLKYIKENIDFVTNSKKKLDILRLVAYDIGMDKIVDSGDGCRMIINDLKPATVEKIVEIIIKETNKNKR